MTKPSFAFGQPAAIPRAIVATGIVNGHAVIQRQEYDRGDKRSQAQVWHRACEQAEAEGNVGQVRGMPRKQRPRGRVSDLDGDLVCVAARVPRRLETRRSLTSRNATALVGSATSYAINSQSYGFRNVPS